MRLKYFVKFLIIGFLQLNVLFSCVGSPVRKPGKSGRNYPPHWWQAFDKSVAYSWEILPQEAKEGEVILSKRNELGILSNFAQTPFVFRGKKYESLEGFWQMMKYPEGSEDIRLKGKNVRWKYTRDQVARMVSFEAKKAGDLASENMKKMNVDWITFEGKRLPYRVHEKGEHYRLIVAATWEKIRYNKKAREVLLSTGDLILRPDHIQKYPPPAWKYYEILMDIRKSFPGKESW